MGNSTLNVCGYIILVFFVILNVLCSILGIVHIGLGSWDVATRGDATFSTDSNLVGSVLQIVGGIVLFLFCIGAIVAALLQWRPLLIVYAFIVSIAVLLNIIGGIITLVFRNDFASTRGVDERAVEEYARYRASGFENATRLEREATLEIIVLQAKYDCCGYYSAFDWIILNPQALRDSPLGIPVPPLYNVSGSGCDECNPAEEGCRTFRGTIDNVPSTLPNISVSYSVTATGCRQFVRDPIIHQTTVRGVASIVFGLIESSAVFLALFLVCFISSARSKETV